VDPDDAEALAAAAVQAATSDSARAGLIDRGLARASAFTWERTAELTDGVVANLLRAG
jgi:glycosyltransferase involved in cell wall biosynthesis